MSTIKFSLLFAFLLLSTLVNAQVVNKCVDAQGQVTFSDEACLKIGGTTASRHQIQGMSSPIKSDAWKTHPRAFLLALIPLISHEILAMLPIQVVMKRNCSFRKNN